MIIMQQVRYEIYEHRKSTLTVRFKEIGLYILRYGQPIYLMVFNQSIVQRQILGVTFVRTHDMS